MARKWFTAEQVVAILREVERATDRSEVLRTHGINDQTYYRWKRMYGGLGSPEVRRIKELEEENRKLKQVAGEQVLVIQTLKEYQKKRGWL